MKFRIYKERHLYFFTCSKCGVVNRKSFKRSRANNQICRKCLKRMVDENQLPIFSEASEA